MIQLESYYAKTHQGPYLNLNEDDIHIDLANRLFVVFDGLGGSGIGDKYVAKVKSRFETFFTKVSNDPDSTLPYYYSPQYTLETNVIINVLHLCHQMLLKDNFDKAMGQRGAVSCTVALMGESICSVVSTGNCASFLYRNSKISLIGSPDCIGPIGSIEQNQMLKTFPTSALGLYDEFSPKVWEVNLYRNDKLLLLSDGIYSRLGDEDIKRSIDRNPKDEFNIISSLIEDSNSRGNLDNQSAIIVSL